MIKEVHLWGFLGNPKKQTFKFHDDINIITGPNGSGKTMLSKLIWGVISGNLAIVVKEVPFEKILIFFYDSNSVEIEILESDDLYETESCRIREIIDKEPNEVYVKLSTKNLSSKYLPDKIEYIKLYKSIFFPTFRRIEGGFGLEEKSSFETPFRLALDDRLSRKLARNRNLDISSSKHQFVFSFSTEDLEEMFEKELNIILKKNEDIQVRTNEAIIDLASDKNVDNEGLKENIQRIVEEAKKQQEKLRSSITQIENLVNELFNKKIKIGGEELGKHIGSVFSSGNLSSGEKQMLSFLVYNAFYENTIIFIDEPELSLHTDWQRRLFPTLLAQDKNNQFFVATHSPLIYNKYEDKEIILKAYSN